MLKAFPLASRVYGWYWCCAGLGCVIPCVAEERPLLNSVAIYTIRNSCKSQLLISSVVLYFVPTASKEKKKIQRFSVEQATKIPPCLLSPSSSFGLYCCEKFTPAFFLSDVSSDSGNIIPAFVLQPKYIKPFRQQSALISL